jgi:hypothetical protein
VQLSFADFGWTDRTDPVQGRTAAANKAIAVIDKAEIVLRVVIVLLSFRFPKVAEQAREYQAISR